MDGHDSGDSAPLTRMKAAFTAGHQRIRDDLASIIALDARDDMTQVLEVFVDFSVILTELMATENDVVFSLFEDCSCMRGVGPTVLLRREHKVIETRLGQIRASLSNGVQGKEVRMGLRALLALLEDHIRREEPVLVAACPYVIEAGQSHRVLGVFE